MPDAVRVKNEPASEPEAEQPGLAETLGAIASPNLLLVGAVATVGILGLVGAALYFWPKPTSAGTKRKVRAKSFAPEPERPSRRKRKKQVRKSRVSATRRRAQRNALPAQGLDLEDERADEDVIDAEGVEVAVA